MNDTLPRARKKPFYGWVIVAAGSGIEFTVGALMQQAFGGYATALPAIGFGMSGRRILERRVVRAATCVAIYQHGLTGLPAIWVRASTTSVFEP